MTPQEIKKLVENTVLEIAPQIKEMVKKFIVTQLNNKRGPSGPPGPRGVVIIGPQGMSGLKGDSIIGPRGPMGLRGLPGSPDTGEDIVKKINSLELLPYKQIDASHIKNLPEAPKVKFQGVLRGGMETIRQDSLSSQLNGSTKIFTLTQNAVRVVALIGSQAPIVYEPTTHFTFTAPVTVTLTDAVGAPLSGQVLLAILQTQ